MSKLLHKEVEAMQLNLMIFVCLSVELMMLYELMTKSSWSNILIDFGLHHM